MKRGRNLLIVFIFLSILGLSFVSSGLISNVWVRITGNAIISNCTDTCYSLNYTCGTANICDKLVNCGSCTVGYVCSSGKCIPQNVTFFKDNFELLLISLLNKATYRNGLGVGSNKSCNEYCQSFGETCVLGQFRFLDNSSYKSELVRCEFKEAGRLTNCVCVKNVSTPCIPTTCALLGKNCGSWSDNCGNILNCGSCLAGQICSNGKCLSSPTCFDSDGGLRYYNKGTLTYTYGYTSTITNDKAIVTDYCSGNYINEAYCFYDSSGISQFGWKGVACNYGCLDGACRKLFLIFK